MLWNQIIEFANIAHMGGARVQAHVNSLLLTEMCSLWEFVQQKAQQVEPVKCAANVISLCKWTASKHMQNRPFANP